MLTRVVELGRSIVSTSRVEQTARSAPARRGGEFFAVPADPTQRRYEALRAYLLEGVPGPVTAARFGYSPETLASIVRDFRAGRRDFFVAAPPGPEDGAGQGGGTRPDHRRCARWDAPPTRSPRHWPAKGGR